MSLNPALEELAFWSTERALRDLLADDIEGRSSMSKGGARAGGGA